MAEGKQIYAFGDDVLDTILIGKSGRGDGSRTGGNHERMTRNNMVKMEKYEVESGIAVLKGLFHAFSPNQYKLPDENTIKRREPVSETISEWEQEKDSEKKEHYYLRQQTGYATQSDAKTRVDLQAVGAHSIVAIYNMESKQYEDENEKEVKAECIANALTKTSACVIRSGWILPGSKYSSNRPPEPTDLLLKILENGAADQKNVILVVNVDELRRCGHNIRKGISWEQLVLEAKQAVEKTKIKGKQITECCKAVLVCIKREGCLLFYQGKTYLFYYCDKIEDDFVKEKKHAVFGSTTVMQAVIAQGLSEEGGENEKVTLCNSVRYGLALMHELLDYGYQMVPLDAKGNEKLSFPYVHIAEEYRALQDKDSKEQSKIHIIKSIEFGEEDLKDKDSITRRVLRGDSPSVAEGVRNECRNFVESGVETASIPYLKLGKLITFDREEVEHIRSIRRIVEQYKQDVNQKTPLSICVFGRPGSGKSFAVKQIVKSLKVKDEDIFEFNLSQMTSIRDLYAAFHQIRDAGLRSGLPVAFFDEFDASIGDTELGWLKYFLAPMQEGEFRENGITHYIGKALFVFAGGTCQSMDELRKKQAQSEMVQQKLPDFLSRIKGYMDVAGPNALPCPVADRPEDCWRKASLKQPAEYEERKHIQSCPYAKTCCLDQSQYLRRAALLRSQLERKLKVKADTDIEIDSRVLDAFLRVEQYKHGARSLTAIVETSHVEPGQPFTVTSIDSSFLNLYATDDFKWYLQ